MRCGVFLRNRLSGAYSRLRDAVIRVYDEAGFRSTIALALCNFFTVRPEQAAYESVYCFDLQSGACIPRRCARREQIRPASTAFTSGVTSTPGGVPGSANLSRATGIGDSPASYNYDCRSDFDPGSAWLCHAPTRDPPAASSARSEERGDSLFIFGLRDSNFLD